MRQRQFAGSSIGAIGLGAASWSLSTATSESDAAQLLTMAVEAGVSYIDTAAAYTTAATESHNEALIARVLGASHEGIVVATKGGHTREGDRFFIDGHPQAIRRDCERSLRALRSDTIDLYYLHKPDPMVAFEDSVGMLETLRLEGKIRATGVSNVTPGQLETALRISPIAAVQNHLSPFNLNDLTTARWAAAHKITYFVFSPLGGAERAHTLNELLPRSAALATTMEMTIEQAVIAWELTQSNAIVPVVGASRAASLQSSVEASALELDDTFLRQINAEIAAVNSPALASR